MVRSPRSAIGAVLLAGALAVSGCSLLNWRPSGVIEPGIVPSGEQTGTQVVERPFAFEDQNVVLRVPVSSAVYAGAVDAQKSAVLIGEVPPSIWVPAYYRAFVDEPHQEAFFTSAREALHQVRTERGLDDSRYVELVTTMVQGMEYRIDPTDLAPKYPIETFGDGYGDCDDKALLAAALLSRDGYDVAILMFEAEKHVALGVRAPGLDYRGTGYAYVEVTAPSLVGVVPEELSGGVRLTSKPDVIRIGEGTRGYAAADRIAFIQKRMGEIETAMSRLRSEISAEEAALSSLKGSLDAQRHSAEAIAEPQAAASAAERYNSQVASYNERVARLNDLVNRHNALVEAMTYVQGHMFARPQVDQRLSAVTL
jgi:hypothetical protein